LLLCTRKHIRRDWSNVLPIEATGTTTGWIA
jgi:hypothetical protein